MKRFAALTVCALIVPSAIASETDTAGAQPRFELFPELNLQVDVSTFALQKNDFYRDNYLAESNTSVELVYLSFRQRWFALCDVLFQINLGRRPDDVVFTVLGANARLSVRFERRLNSVILQTGIEHRCFHGVDRLEYPIVHWNCLFLAAGSPAMRICDYRLRLVETDGWTMRNRLSYLVRGGYYLKEFFGVVSEEKLNGYNPRICQFDGQTRFAFYRRRSWIVTAEADAMAGAYERDGGEIGLFWQVAAGAKAYVRRGKRGAAVGAKLYFDQLPLIQTVPRFSRDRLLEIGVSFFN
jgi:hypothetical protein